MWLDDALILSAVPAYMIRDATSLMVSQDEPTIEPAISKMEHEAAREKVPAHESAEIALSTLGRGRLSTSLFRLMLGEQF